MTTGDQSPFSARDLPEQLSLHGGDSSPCLANLDEGGSISPKARLAALLSDGCSYQLLEQYFCVLEI
jgi:hypothetical protein